MADLKAPIVNEQVAHQLLRQAERAKANTYPISGEGYACALLTGKGNIYEGVSYTSDTQTLTMHCEMTAFANAAIHGEKEVVAITGPNCHMCKQFIWESALKSGIDIQIIIQEDEGIKFVPISSLMQYPWPDG